MIKTITALPTEKLLSERWKSISSKNSFGIVIILAILFIRFFRTIVFGKSISKLFLLSHWDPCFSALRSGQNFGIDGTLLLVLIPYRFFVAQCWRHTIPLWNELSGFGMPLLADPQSIVFSPVLIPFFLCPTMYMWNQTLIIQLTIASITTYLLCLELEFGPLTGVVAALLFAFCPWVQWQLEIIGNGVCLTPFVFLFFVKAAKKDSVMCAFIAGIAAAITILAGHPEISFVTVVFATVFMYLTAYIQSPVDFSFWKISKCVLLIGMVAFGLTAVVLLPFKEYIANGYTYKLSTSAPANISWQALLANYFYPFHPQGSVFWGPVSWLGFAGLITFFSKRDRFASCIAAGSVLSFLFIPKLFPLSILFGIFPFSSVESLYCLPEYILFVSILSGLGIKAAFAKDITWKNFFALSALTIVPIMVSALLSFWHPQDSYIRTDQASELAHFSWKLWRINTFCVMGLLTACLLLRNRSRFVNIAGGIALITLSLANLLFLSHAALPIRPDFNYSQNLPDLLSVKPDKRFITVGSRIFRHNTNLIYGLSNVQTYNPLLPRNFVEFMEACGAQTNDRFSQIFSPMISGNIDLTGAETIVSEQPLLDQRAVSAEPSRGTAIYANGLKLSNIKFFRDNKAIFCYVLADPNLAANQNCSLYLDVIKTDGTRYALGDPQPIASWRLKQSLVFSGPAPDNQKHWLISAKLISDQNQQLIAPTKTTFGQIEIDGSWTISTSESGSFTEVKNNRFKPISSFNNITTYKNLTAFKRYFFVRSIAWVKDSQQALKLLNTSGGLLGKIVIMENSQKRDFENQLNKIASSDIFDISGSVEKLDISDKLNCFANSSNSALVTDTKKPALLVISDMFYPGWKAFLDGKEWPIFRADCLFRSVLIPSGKHQIVFEYHPWSFAIGAMLFAITITVISLVYIKSRRN